MSSCLLSGLVFEIRQEYSLDDMLDSAFCFESFRFHVEQ